MSLDPPPGSLSPELVIEFAKHAIDGLPKPTGTLDKLRDVLRTLFRCIKREQDSPAKDTMFKKAKAELILQRTLVMTMPPPFLDWNKLIGFLKENPLSPSARWEEIRNRAMVLYTIVLGRRPSNPARAIAPLPAEITPWGIRISESKFKQDDSRRGHLVFLPVAHNQDVCPVAALKRYLDHPTTKALLQ